ncbi:hypothetical protein [Bacillus sp. es.034]|uniref:hypothetical protein n=1 Tax=Bacillus sp. es.034 TaxID=1761763 RepID=UPI000BF3BF4B|nr:hypothetical protein [Bacillus sp. es.034]PFG05290.1 hypothetical protein ATG71_2119 [Bacillus sp. es.034]
MNEHQKIHILCNELMPLYSELDQPTQEIINEHAEHCKVCNESIHRFTLTFSAEVPPEIKDHSVSIKPFKSLILFKTLLTVFFILIRGVVLGLLTANWINHYSNEQPALLISSLLLYYFPLVTLINSINFVFFRNKWFWIMLIIDILILCFFDNMIM